MGIYLFIAFICFGIAFFGITNRATREILSISNLKNNVSGNSMNSLEAYRVQMNAKCAGPILDSGIFQERCRVDFHDAC
jgi:hypothetical protein